MPVKNRARFPRRAAKVTLMLAALAVSCGKKTALTPPAAPRPVTREAVAAPEPLSEPQTIATLPPAQPVPASAALDEPSGLALAPPATAAGPERDPAGGEGALAGGQPGGQPGAEVAGESGGEPRPRAGASGLRLGQILSAEERRNLRQEITESLSEAQRNLTYISERRPALEQSRQAQRIRAFMKQAREIQRQDLPLAKNLAERARLLAEDLAKNMR